MLKDQLLADLKQAMKDNNTIQKNTIQLIRASILQTEKDKFTLLEDKQIEDIIMKEKKKRLEALAQYEKSNRNDLIEQTKKEIFYISKYLPQPLPESEIKAKVEEVITELNATHKQFGKVMRESKERLGNAVDGKLLNKIVRELLNIKD